LVKNPNKSNVDRNVSQIDLQTRSFYFYDLHANKNDMFEIGNCLMQIELDMLTIMEVKNKTLFFFNENEKQILFFLKNSFRRSHIG
jgi:hypothetical protein